ncbi:MAG: hypothetical protein ACE5JQ_15600 [Candidatus Methylomirabilales bacterium]
MRKLAAIIVGIGIAVAVVGPFMQAMYIEQFKSGFCMAAFDKSLERARRLIDERRFDDAEMTGRLAKVMFDKCMERSSIKSFLFAGLVISAFGILLLAIRRSEAKAAQ